MKALFTFLFLGITLSIFSQNWRGFDPDFANYYADELEQVHAIDLDSSITNSSDTLHYNYKIIKLDRTLEDWSNYDRVDVYARNQPSWIGERIKFSPNTETYYTETGDSILYNRINGTLQFKNEILTGSKGIHSVFGQTDSTLTFTISNAQLILSKTYGWTKVLPFKEIDSFGLFNSNSAVYQLIGTEKESKGWQNFSEIENKGYEIGCEIHTESEHSSIHSYWGDIEVKRITDIVDHEEYEEIHFEGCYYVEGNYSNINTTEKIYKNTYSYKYTFQNGSDFLIKKQNHLIKKGIVNHYWNHGDTIVDFNNLKQPDTLYIQSPDLGTTFYSSGYSGEDCTNSKINTVYFKNSKIEYGTPVSCEVLEARSEMIKDTSLNYTDNIKVSISNEAIEILNTGNGKPVILSNTVGLYTEKWSNPNTFIRINISNYSKGMYILIVGDTIRKFIKP